jgi:hypothetical protein
MSKLALLTLALVALAGGCSAAHSGPPDLALPLDLLPPPDLMPPASVSGTIAGRAFPVGAAIFYATAPQQIIQLSTNKTACGDQLNNILRRNTRDLMFQTNTPWQTGAYNIVTATPTGMNAIAYWRSIAADCSLGNGNATTGTLTLTSVSGDVILGMFDATFDNGDHATGSFTAVNCPGTSTNPPVMCP